MYKLRLFYTNETERTLEYISLQKAIQAESYYFNLKRVKGTRLLYGDEE